MQVLISVAIGTILYWCLIGLFVFILVRISIRFYGHPSVLYSLWRPYMLGYGWIVWMALIVLLFYKL